MPNLNLTLDQVLKAGKPAEALSVDLPRNVKWYYVPDDKGEELQYDTGSHRYTMGGDERCLVIAMPPGTAPMSHTVPEMGWRHYNFCDCEFCAT
jgi:hypothetical protein